MESPQVLHQQILQKILRKIFLKSIWRLHIRVFFFFFWIIKNLLPKGQSPNKQLKNSTKPKATRENENRQHFPYKHRRRGISQKQNPPEWYHTLDPQNRTNPKNRATNQPTRENTSPYPGTRHTNKPAHIPGIGPPERLVNINNIWRYGIHTTARVSRLVSMFLFLQFLELLLG